MPPKYEQMIKTNMEVVRYFAEKNNGKIGMFSKYDGKYVPIDLSQSNLTIWNKISAFMSDNFFESSLITSEQFALEANDYTAYQMQRYKEPVLIFKRLDTDNCNWAIILDVTKPFLLSQYIDGVKYAYGISATGTSFQLSVFSKNFDMSNFLKRYEEMENQIKKNLSEIERYKLSRKNYEQKLKLMRMNDDF